METYNIGHYTIAVETNQMSRPGDYINVTVKSNRTNAKYGYVYSLLLNTDDAPKDLAKRAFIHYTMGTKPDGRVLIQRKINRSYGEIKTNAELFRVIRELANAGYFFKVTNGFNGNGRAFYMVDVLGHKSE